MAAYSSDIAIIVDPAYTLPQAIETVSTLGHHNSLPGVAAPPGRSIGVSALGRWRLIAASPVWFGACQRSAGY